MITTTTSQENEEESISLSSSSTSSVVVAVATLSDLQEEPLEKKHRRQTLESCSIAMAALFLVSQFCGGSNTAEGATSAPTSSNMLLSAVSATLLRQQKGGQVSRLFNAQNVLCFILLWQGAQQASHLVQTLLSFGGLFSSWYMGVLVRFPLITKSLTAAVIGLLGDAAAQFLEQRILAKKEGTTIHVLRNFDRRRALAVLGDGCLVSGPILHIAYDFMESIIPVAGPYASLAALSHVLMDNFILDLMFVAIMFVSTGIVEGYNPRQILSQMRNDYFNTVKAGSATSFALLPLLFVCFRFLPVSFRVMGMNVIDVIWQGIISYMVHRRRRTSNLSEKGVDEKSAAPILPQPVLL